MGRLLLFLGIVIGASALVFGVTNFIQPLTPVTAANVQPVAVDKVVDSDCSISTNFPDNVRRWCGLISQHAAYHGIDPNLIAAMIWQESGGNPDAYSKDGAVGLMQVMPRDGLAAAFMCPNGPCFANRPSMQELYDPAFNIEYGVRFLSGLVSRHGNTRDALKAYGPANVGYYYADIVLGLYERR
jgi:soluble lytic murein transglycosylase-like protein